MILASYVIPRLIVHATKAVYKYSCKHLLISKLPLTNTLLRDLSCLNPLKRKLETTLGAIANVCQKVNPGLDSAAVLDDWRMYQCANVPSFSETEDRVDHYWREVLSITDACGDQKFPTLSTCVKTFLTLGQGNADAERSLSVNGNVVTKNRVHLHPRSITGLRSGKAACHFHDPVKARPENVPITRTLRTYVRGAKAAFEQRLKEEKVCG